ncbi:MAG: hypothetical protein JKY95_05405 [Planctomycetaceae bacterium]|nr:hypothetical protein [Planctomycetaceae bacterium]
MDLRICPSCEQSVLDDDVQDCPFCDAKMDGSGPAREPKASAAASKKKPAEKKPAAKPQAAPEKQNDDPFAVEAKSNKHVAALRRKPTAKTTFRVICPMCDTAGFATPAVAGKEVKCPNPKCMMPIFTAPEIKKEEPVEEKKPIFTPALIAGLGGAAVILGILVYFFVIQDSKPAPGPGPDDPIDGETPPKKDEPGPETNEKDLPPKISIAELKRLIFKENVKTVLQRSNNRSKPYCRQLSAETYAELGDIKAALYQLKKLDGLNSGLSFFKITPLVDISWQHLANGDREAARKVAKQAQALTTELPNRGNDAIIHTVFLGTLLIAIEEHDTAHALIAAREKVQNADLTSVRTSLIRQDNSFDLDQNYQWLPQLDLDAPLTFATVYGAVVRGYDKQALDWINSLTNPAHKSDALAGYTVGMCIKDPAFDVLQKLNVTGMTEQDKQRAVAMGLQVKAYQQKTAQAKTVISNLQKEIAAWKPNTPATIPDFKAIYQRKNKRAAREVYVAIQTHYLTARYLAKHEQPDQAWKQIELALTWATAIAPSHNQAKALSQNMERNRDQIQNDLAKEFKITQAVSQRNAFNKYRTNVSEIESDAKLRLELETGLLRDALKWGLASQLYNRYQQDVADKKTDPNLVQAVEESLLSDLAFGLESAKNLQASSELNEKFSNRISPQSSLKSWLQLQRLIDAGSVSQAHKLLDQEKGNLHEPQLEIRLACKFAQNATAQTTINWLNSIPDIIEQELAFQLTATLAAQRGLIREYWDVCKEQSLSATKKCSVHLGLIEGLLHTNVYKKEEQPKPEPQTEK